MAAYNTNTNRTKFLPGDRVRNLVTGKVWIVKEYALDPHTFISKVLVKDGMSREAFEEFELEKLEPHDPNVEQYEATTQKDGRNIAWRIVDLEWPQIDVGRSVPPHRSGGGYSFRDYLNDMLQVSTKSSARHALTSQGEPPSQSSSTEKHTASSSAPVDKKRE